MNGVDVAAFALRLGVGATFVFAGLDKVARDPAQVVDYVTSLGVPWPDVVGPVLGAFELVAGLALVLGVLTRSLAAALVVELVAIILVRLPDAVGARSVVEMFLAVRLELVLISAAIALVALGGGAWTLPRSIAGAGRRLVVAVRRGAGDRR